jgi:hypothetical protein
MWVGSELPARRTTKSIRAIEAKSMRRNCRSQRPIVEQCESRNLLTTGVAGMHASALVSAQPIRLIVPLNGSFQGQFVDVDKIPDVGATFTETGSGHIRRIGHFSLTGTVHTIGFIQVGPVEGKFVLAGPGGTIAIKLTAIERGTGATGLTGHYNYKIVGGTGRYTNAVDSGTATLTTVVSKVPSSAFGVQHGHFKLVLNSAF